MFQLFLNPWMLTGLLGIGLPLIAHLLSRRRFDVVEWGAMQFLNPSRKTRRRLRLEELLLLLLRTGLITTIVLSVTRPWIPGGWLSGFRSSGSRTVVLVIDGSNSMSRADGVNSLHQNAIRRATEFLQTLNGDDSVAVVDARDQPSAIISAPLKDLKVVSDELQKISPPAGSFAVLPALEKALGILGRSSAAAREIVVFTDGQGNNWQTQQESEWIRFDDLLKFPAVRPGVWVVDVGEAAGAVRRNVAVGKIQLSREITVPGFPLRIQASVSNSSDAEVVVPVRLLLDEQPLAGQQRKISIPPRSETQLEFEYTLRTEGNHVLSVEAETSDDAWTVDDLGHASVHVAKSLPILLINGTATSAPADRDTFFAELAFSSSQQGVPWVATRVLDAAEVQPEDLISVAAVICCNVSRLSPSVSAALEQFAADGNGVLIASGPGTTTESFRSCFVQSGLIPSLEAVRIREAGPAATDTVRVAPLSIQPGWLERFRSDPARSFLKASFQQWTLFKITPPDTGTGNPLQKKSDESSSGMQSPDSAPKAGPNPSAGSPGTQTPMVLAQLASGDPLILEVRHGKGLILLLTTTLDRQWSDLPTRSDFVPFLHEAVFHIASARSHRNLNSGESLVMQISDVTSKDFAAPDSATKPAGASDNPAGKPAQEFSSDDFQFRFVFPDGRERLVTPAEDGAERTGILAGASLPGIYRGSLLHKQQVVAEDVFVVNYDHSEDRYASRTQDDVSRLATNDRVRFAKSLDELTQRMYGDESVTELWAVLLTLFLIFLVAELALTRRVILRGYGGEALSQT